MRNSGNGVGITAHHLGQLTSVPEIEMLAAKVISKSCTFTTSMLCPYERFAVI